MLNRFTLITALLISISLLAIYSSHFHPWIEVDECLQNPDEYEGRMVTHYSEPTIGEIYSDGFYLLQRHGPSIRVYADTTGLSAGEYIGMKAIFHKEGYLTAVSLVVAKNRRYKIWLSVFPVLLIAFLLVRYYRINWKKIQIELREHA